MRPVSIAHSFTVCVLLTVAHGAAKLRAHSSPKHGSPLESSGEMERINSILSKELDLLSGTPRPVRETPSSSRSLFSQVRYLHA